ncbi:MAG TPA: VOC family protein [Usitatibacter sp.]|nr:VOC family protein [Usitatibacter sp.]
MDLELDHLVVAARRLEEGVAWAESRLGSAMGPGGKHDAMGTHNRLLSLGPGRFLEVIAVDFRAQAPARPRWFSLDEPAMAQRLSRGPALVHWVVRSSDIDAALGACLDEVPPVLALSRGEYRWRIGVPASGHLQADGIVPTMIQWSGKRPAQALPESGCRLESLVLRHPQAPPVLAALRAAGLPESDPVEAFPAGRGLQARIRTPRGIVTLGEAAE